jgi:hypothetical protein
LASSEPVGGLYDPFLDASGGLVAVYIRRSAKEHHLTLRLLSRYALRIGVFKFLNDAEPHRAPGFYHIGLGRVNKRKRPGPFDPGRYDGPTLY